MLPSHSTPGNHASRVSRASAVSPPTSPSRTGLHSRRSSSISLAQWPRRLQSPKTPYSPYSPASEHDAFLSSPPTPSARSPTSPSFLISPRAATFGTTVTNFIESRTPLPLASKRLLSRRVLLLVCLGPALLALLLLSPAAYNEQDRPIVVQHVHETIQHGWSKVQDGVGALKTWTGSLVNTEGFSVPATGPIEISVLPKPRAPKLDDPDAKYLGYLPHSGYHNQRIELVQAMILAKMLNRTLLVPPIWIGWPTGWSYYDVLQGVWNDAMRTTESSFALPNRTVEEQAAMYEPAPFVSTRRDFPLVGSVYDDPLRDEKMEASKAEKKAAWENLGYEVRPDGYPITNLTAADCKSYPYECRHTYKDTFLSWDSLVNLDKAAAEVKLVDRWDFRERALEPLLNITADDVFVFQDEIRYDFQFDVRAPAEAGLVSPNTNNLTHWARTVSIPAMRELEHKVILVGTLFGSGRIRGGDGFRYNDPGLGQYLRRSMAFDNPWILQPADEIRDQLGGSKGYFGVHARVGDGVFADHAAENMEKAWWSLVGKMGVDTAIAEQMWDSVKSWNGEDDEQPSEDGTLEEDAAPIEVDTLVEGEQPVEPEQPVEGETLVDEERVIEKRSAPTGANGSQWALLDGDELDYDSQDSWHTLQKRAVRRRAVQPEVNLKTLTCRSPLYTVPELQIFNTPLYLATDSRLPLEDPNLAIFFNTFPCTFVLSDFTTSNELNGERVVQSANDMTRLVNKADGVSLGRLFLPFLEAVIAAKALVTAGTYGSTFSVFAQGSLHDAYRELDGEPLSDGATLSDEDNSFGPGEGNVEGRRHKRLHRRDLH